MTPAPAEAEAAPKLYLCLVCGSRYSERALVCRACGGSATITSAGLRAYGEWIRSRKRPAAFLTGWREVDEFSPGLFQLGALTALYGSPGAGKSSLACQIAACCARTQTALYFSTEESEEMIRRRILRTAGCLEPDLVIRGGSTLQEFLRALEETKPAFCVLDSISRLYDQEYRGQPGGRHQIARCATRIQAACQLHRTAGLILCHTTKMGQIAGWSGLSFDADCVLALKGREGPLRVLYALKNRHGSTDDPLFLKMTPSGLFAVSQDSFLPHRKDPPPGCCFTVAVLAGRYFCGEIQAATAPPSKRILLDNLPGRVRQVLASFNGLFPEKGIRLRSYFPEKPQDPACDLAVAAAVLSAAKQKPLPADVLFIGEIDGLGNVLAVSDLSERLRRAVRRGFRACVAGPALPSGNGWRGAERRNSTRPEVIRISNLRQLSEVMKRMR